MSDPPVTVKALGRTSPPGCRVESLGGTTMAETEPKSERVNLRATKHQVAVLRQASLLAGLTLTSYILSTAVSRAELEIQSLTSTNPEQP